jgi:superfamily II DNA helicase RecQ
MSRAERRALVERADPALPVTQQCRVIHFLLPESLGQYYQEVGRAGRDGAPAFGLLLYTPKNAKVRKDMINAGKRTADRVLALWSGVITSGHSEVRSLNPNRARISTERTRRNSTVRATAATLADAMTSRISAKASAPVGALGALGAL